MDFTASDMFDVCAVSARKADSKFHGFFESQQKDLEYVQREVEKKKEQRNNL